MVRGPPSGGNDRHCSPDEEITVIKTKTWNQRRDKDDGFRLLICRYRPRALPKKDETWDLWWAHLGPTKELHAAFYGKKGPPINWEEYRRRYLEEMRGEEQRETIDFLAEQVAAGKTITLLCSSACTDGIHCHRFLLKQLIEARLPKVVTTKRR
jgi:uncharacterized protein YeaO (DUF488 family)